MAVHVTTFMTRKHVSTKQIIKFHSTEKLACTRQSVNYGAKPGTG